MKFFGNQIRAKNRLYKQKESFVAVPNETNKDMVILRGAYAETERNHFAGFLLRRRSVYSAVFAFPVFRHAVSFGFGSGLRT